MFNDLVVPRDDVTAARSLVVSCRRTVLLLAAVVAFFAPPPVRGAEGQELYFVDAHSQADEDVTDLESVIRRMDAAGVRRTILTARSGRRPGEIADLAMQHPDRIVPAVRTKADSFDKDPARWRQFIQAQLDSGRFASMAEVLVFHAQKGKKAPEVRVDPDDDRVKFDPDDDRVKFALAAAAERHWPFVVHIEFASLAPQDRQRFMAGLEKMLREHRELPILLNHMGQLQPAEAARLIESHPNFHLLTAHTTSAITRESREPWTPMFQGDRLLPAWKALIEAHPDRFVFALDNVWSEHWERFYLEQIGQWRKALAEVQPSVAHALAHGNAERLWRLEPRM